MEGFSFSTDVRVRFAETDAQGIAHNSNYFIWFEVARVAYLEEYAGGYQRLRDLGLEAVVLETHVRYLEPARFDDRLTVHARCLDVRGARFRYEYEIERDGTADRGRLDRPRDRRRKDDAAYPGTVVVAGGDCFCGVVVVDVVVVPVVVVSVFGFFFGPTRMIFGWES